MLLLCEPVGNTLCSDFKNSECTARHNPERPLLRKLPLILATLLYLLCPIKYMRAQCDGCFATIGLGANLNPKSLTDYNNSSNILQATHLGNATPQLLVGLSYQVAWHGIGYAHIHSGDTKCDATKDTQDVGGSLIYCYPWRPFVNAKFTTDASQTFNGFNFGMSHRLAKQLDLLIGYSFTAFNEPSDGFRRAAIQTVQTQQAAANPYYSAYSVLALQKNWSDAYDGFPAQLISSSGTAGTLIYSGTPLSVHYHSGAFIGISIPIALKTLIGEK